VTTFGGWENAFVAMSVALGASVDEACLSLDDAARARAEALLRGLAHEVREGRAKALAAGLAQVTIAIEQMRLA
jgi:hypothetical protein